MGQPAGIRVDGVRELVRAIDRMEVGYRKEIGKANKAIGQRIIDHAFPKPETVGAGTGAKPRASASATSLRIVAGHKGRRRVAQQWGVRFKERTAKRPFLKREAERDMPKIEQEWLLVLLRAANRVGLDSRKG